MGHYLGLMPTWQLLGHDIPTAVASPPGCSAEFPPDRDPFETPTSEMGTSPRMHILYLISLRARHGAAAQRIERNLWRAEQAHRKPCLTESSRYGTERPAVT